jgi:hypothetical protein
MTLTTTFRRLRSARACTERYKFLRAALKDVKDTEPINLLTILETNGLDDALWALSATAENCEMVARLMSADFAEEVLPLWQKYSQDKRPELAIKAARDFAHGRISVKERDAAWAAVRAAAWAAAGDAAGDAAWAAARAAAWEAAGAAAGTAARDAARAAAGAAARDAAWAAAWAAAGAKQIEIFTRYLQDEAAQ